MFKKKKEVIPMDQTYMKEQPILRLVLTMSLPMILSMAVNSLYNIIDSFFVAKISEQAMTALSLVYPVQNLCNAVNIGFAVGMNAVIAFYLGAQDHKMADASATQAALHSALHGIVLTVGCIVIMPSFLQSFTSDEETILLGLQYSNIVFAFSVIIALELFFEKLFQAVGQMTVSMISMLLGCVANIILDPILIFGLGPVPALGIYGAAIATGAGQTLTLAVYLAIYVKKPLPVKVSLRGFRWNWSLTARLYSIGIPAILNQALPSLLISALNSILAAYSQVYVLVLGIYYKLQTFLYLSANGLIQGIRPLIGYNYGAGEHRRVKKIYFTTLFLTAAIMAAGTGVCLAFPEALIHLFTGNEETVRIGAHALRVISAGFVVSSVSIVSSGTLEGLGKGFPSLLISLCRYLIIIVPAAYLLAHFAGANGVWHAFWITELCAAAVSWVLYLRDIRKGPAISR